MVSSETERIAALTASSISAGMRDEVGAAKIVISSLYPKCHLRPFAGTIET